MGSQGSEMWGNVLAVTVEIRASVQTWSSDILESRQLLIDAWKHFFFFFFAFHSLKEHRFHSILFAESNRLLGNSCLKVISKYQFPLPCVPIGKAPTLTEKSKQTSKHLFHEVLCRRDPVILSLSGKFLDSAWTHTEYEPGHWTLLAKLAFSLCWP